MLGMTLQANCTRVEVTGNWEVFCLRCAASIGTMSSEMLRDAVFLTKQRGGILCPDCRANSCAKCGNEMQANANNGFVPRRNGTGETCHICELERLSPAYTHGDDGEADGRGALPCLVPQKSKRARDELIAFFQKYRFCSWRPHSDEAENCE